MSEMRLNYNQQLQQTMRLSPRMLQSINLIAMPIEDLREHIYEEAEKNPAIEILQDSVRSPSADSSSPHIGSSADSDAWQAFLENTPAATESLQEHLLAQLSLLHLTEDQQRIGKRIIQNLNARGYHNAPPESLLTVDDPLSLLNEMLHIVRCLEPQGTACTDLRESLFVQAELKIDAEKQNFASLSEQERKERRLALLILKSHFDILEKKRNTLMCRALNERNVPCSQKEFDGALAFIRTLDPFLKLPSAVQTSGKAAAQNPYLLSNLYGADCPKSLFLPCTKNLPSKIPTHALGNLHTMRCVKLKVLSKTSV